jgi:hypothetical protein
LVWSGCLSRRQDRQTIEILWKNLLLGGVLGLHTRPITLATDAANPGIECGALTILRLLATLAANFGVKLRAMLTPNRVSALFADA